MKFLNINAVPLSPAILQAAISLSGLKWRMHPAQIFALEVQHLDGLLEVVAEAKLGNTFPAMNAMKTLRVLAGIPVEPDDAIEKSTIELWAGEAVIFWIEMAAIPQAFAFRT